MTIIDDMKTKYFRIFLKASLYFIVVMSFITMVLRGDTSQELKNALYAGTAFGISMVLFTFFADLRLRKRGIVVPSDNPKINQIFLIEKPFEKTFAGCEKAILSIQNITIESSDKTKGKIVAGVGFSRKSIGEKVSISIVRIGLDKSLLLIKSYPSYKPTTFDYGKNFENVFLIVHHLKNDFSGAVRDIS